ncbi:MAG: YbjN domain-containing protein [Alphaproteobacteria bacterium]|nr:YbjN domain-containing protein [Alphaproteobacteria bacterium]
MFVKLMLGFLGVFVMAGPVAAQIRDTLNLFEFEQVLIDAGFAPEMSVPQSSGEPHARIFAGGFNFTVIGKECAASSCEVMLFVANFDLDRDVVFKDYEIVNSYNDTQLSGRAYVLVDDRQVGIDQVIDLRGGVSQEFILLKAGRFPDLVQTFTEHYQNENGE